MIKKLKERRFDKVFIFSSSLRYFLASKFAGIKKIAQYPLFRKKDNIVTSAKIFTEKEFNYKHVDPVYNDYQKQLLLPHKLSQSGPAPISTS